MTVVIENINTSGTDVSVPLLDQSKLKFEATKSSKSSDGNSFKAAYVYAGSNAASETLVEVTCTYVPTQDIMRHSIRLTTTETNDASGVTVRRPIEALIAFNTPGRHYADAQKVLHLIGNAYSLCWNTLVSKVPQLEVVNAVNLDAISDLY